MLLWFIIGTGVITISAVSIVATAYIIVTNWIDKHLGGEPK